MLFPCKTDGREENEMVTVNETKANAQSQDPLLLTRARFYLCPRFSSGSRLLQNTCAFRSLPLSANSYRFILALSRLTLVHQTHSLSLGLFYMSYFIFPFLLSYFLFAYVFDYMPFLLSFYGVVLVYDVVSTAISPSLCD